LYSLGLELFSSFVIMERSCWVDGKLEWNIFSGRHQYNAFKCRFNLEQGSHFSFDEAAIACRMIDSRTEF